MDTSIRTSLTLLMRLQQESTDEAAWHEFVERYSPQMFRWCRYWMPQRADAEEIVQNVLLTLARKFRTFQYDRSKGTFRAWLKTLIHHAWHDFVTSQNRIAVGTGDSDMMRLLQETEARSDLLRRLEAEYDIELLEVACQRVQECVEPQTWRAYQLTAVEGLSGAAAAKQLGMKVGTVYVAKSEVQRRLKEEVEKLERSAEIPA